jgi:hypothetical protein
MAIIFSFFEKMVKKKPLKLHAFIWFSGGKKKSQGANTHHKKIIPHANY